MKNDSRDGGDESPERGSKEGKTELQISTAKKTPAELLSMQEYVNTCYYISNLPYDLK